MKSNCLRTAAFAALLSCAYEQPKAQANPALSNLSATAVNADLIPGATGTLNLGAAAAAWKDFYLSHYLFLGGRPFLNAGGPITANNTALGSLSLASNVSGVSNAALGDSTLYFNTVGYSNVAIGFRSLTKNLSGHHNVAVGALTLHNNISGLSNTALGNNAMFSNISGVNNLAAGANALYFNTIGGANVAVGLRAMFHSRVNSYQVAIGDSSLFLATLNSSGNTAVGSKALYGTTTMFNTGIGAQSLKFNTANGSNTAFGAFSMAGMNGSGSCLAIGNYAGYNLNSSSAQVAIGDSALSNSTSSANVAIGEKALASATSGEGNVGIGQLTLSIETNGGGLIAIGNQALPLLSHSSGDVAIGQSAGLFATGNFLTIVGHDAFSHNHRDFLSTAFGAGADAIIDTLPFVSVLGANALATASFQVMLGDLNVTSVLAAGSYMIYSDGRFKKNVKADVPGIHFLQALRPVSYTYDVNGIDRALGGPEIRSHAQSVRSQRKENISSDEDAIRQAAMNTKEKKTYTGFIAQEVETAAQKINYPFSGLHVPANDKDLYALSYSDFVPPIVKGLQDLSSTDSAADAAITLLSARIDSARGELEQLMKALKASHVNGKLSDASPAPVSPDPFRRSTGNNPSQETAKNNSTNPL